MKNKRHVDHQFSLFSFNDMKPKTKVPISKERIEQIKKLIEKRDGENAAIILRGIREKLEDYESKIK